MHASLSDLDRSPYALDGLVRFCIVFLGGEGGGVGEAGEGEGRGEREAGEGGGIREGGEAFGGGESKNAIGDL